MRANVRTHKIERSSIFYSPITFTMKPIKTNCIFCDSTSHDFKKCTTIRNSNTKIMQCMQSETCPDFNSFTTKELKLVAYLHPFEKGISHHQNAYFTNGYGNTTNRKMVRNQIPLTLSKRRLVDALSKRWASLQPIIKQSLSPPECDECPICYETINELNWKGYKWKKNRLYTRSGSDIYWPIKTKCGHIFCGSCWRQHKREQHSISCPMCRTKVHHSEITLLDNNTCRNSSSTHSSTTQGDGNEITLLDDDPWANITIQGAYWEL